MISFEPFDHGDGAPRGRFDTSPLVKRALRKKRLFGDGRPYWTNAPTSADAIAARRGAVKRLRYFAESVPEGAGLADKIEACKKGRRCKDGACPECGRGFQRFVVGGLERLASQAAEIVAISIAFPKHRVTADRLSDLQTIHIKRSLADAVKNADDVGWIVGGIDLSLNDDLQKGQGIAWQPQFYGFAATSNVTVLAGVLREAYSPTKTVPRPVHIKEWDGSERAFSYCWKTDFYRRVAYQREVGPPDNRRTCWHTRKVSLRPPEHVQAMLWMHQEGLAGRLFLKGVRMTRVGDGVGLVRIKKRE